MNGYRVVDTETAVWVTKLEQEGRGGEKRLVEVAGLTNG
jgi:hypothetical protein